MLGITSEVKIHQQQISLTVIISLSIISTKYLVRSVSVSNQDGAFITALSAKIDVVFCYSNLEDVR